MAEINNLIGDLRVVQMHIKSLMNLGMCKEKNSPNKTLS